MGEGVKVRELEGEASMCFILGEICRTNQLK